MSAQAITKHKTTIAKPVAAEDLRVGDMVAVLNEVCEFPSYPWHCDSATLSPHEPVRVQYHGATGGTPLKVKAICLPFVFVKTPNGWHETLDMRDCQLARLRRGYARRAWKALRKPANRRRHCW